MLQFLQNASRMLNQREFIRFVRVFVAFMVALYAVGKLGKGQFIYEGEIMQRPVGELSGFELTWVFFGHNYGYVVIIGLAQLAGAALLAFRRTSLLGALMLFPVMFNIVVVDIFYGIPAGATANALLFTLGLLLVCWSERARLFKVFQLLLLPAAPGPARPLPRWKPWLGTGLSFALGLGTFWLLQQVVLNLLKWLLPEIVP